MDSGAQPGRGRSIAVAGLIAATAACLPATFDTPASHAAAQLHQPIAIDPSEWRHVATVSREYLSYNVEMAEVTGGEFWAPYDDPAKRRLAPRSPLDLADSRLRLLGQALSPAIVRVSGTWANSTYVPALSEIAPTAPPMGFRQVLTAERWNALTAFVKQSGSSLLLSVPVSDGARDPAGVWQTEQAARLIARTRKAGATIRALEFANEPNLVGLGALPQGYAADQYARDFRRFVDFARSAAPDATILAHSASGRGGELPAEDLTRAAAGLADAVSYHFYGALSERCADYGNQTTADAALGEAWLARTDEDFRWYAALRDRYDPGKPIWLSETAQAACGGDRWARTFRDSFRFADQLGRLAQQGVKVVAHNTLASGDYALIERTTMAPRPNFWIAWLWKQTMGSKVLRPDPAPPGLHIYAHCTAGRPRAVSLVLIELTGEPREIMLPGAGMQWTVTADALDSGEVRINGTQPSLESLRGPVGRLAAPVSGRFKLPAHAIAFVELPKAGAASCR